MLWRFYPAIMMRSIMPLARFFYGETHKWYFRTAGTALAATLVTAISIRFKGDARWAAYLLSFAGVSVLYWLIYAPAKWSDKECIPPEEKTTSPRDFHTEVLTLGPAREIVRINPSHERHFGPKIPIEIELLHRYTMLDGYRPLRGNYLYTREWRPPGYWSGKSEFSDLLAAAEAHRDHLFYRLEHSDTETTSMFAGLQRSGHNPKIEAARTLTLALYLDACRPNWRRHANLWAQKKWRRAFMWTLWRHRPAYAA